MSLINKLLTDLESRQSTMRQNNDLVLDGLYSAYDIEVDNDPVNRKPFYVVLFILAGIITSLLVWFNFSQMNWLHTEVIMNEDVSPGEVIINDKPEPAVMAGTEVPRTVNDDWSLPSLKLDDLPDMWVGRQAGNTSNRKELFISDINMQRADNNIILSFNLPAQIDYRAYTLESPYRAVIELNNMDYTGGLPQIESFTEITNIRKRRNDRGIFIFVLESTNPLSILNTGYLQSYNKNELQITLSGKHHEPDLISDLNADVSVSEQEIAAQGFSGQTVTQGDLIKSPNKLPQRSAVDKLLVRSQQLYQQGKIAEGLDTLYSAVKVDDSHSLARTTLALRLVKQGQRGMAVSLLEEGLNKFPAQSDWAELLARIYLDTGDLEMARSVLENTMPPVAEDPEYHALYAAILQQMNLHEKAALTYRDLVKIRPENGIWWMGFAISLERVSRKEDAMFAYKNALKGQSLTPESHSYIVERIRYLDNHLSNEST